MNEEKLKALYEGLSGTYDLGTYDDFVVKMGDQNKRKVLYDAAATEFDLGTFDEFEGKIGVKKKEPTGDVSATGTEPTSPSKSPSPSTKKINLQDMVAGVRQPTSQVDVEVQQTRKPPAKIGPREISTTPPVEQTEEVDEFVQQGEVGQIPLPPEEEVTMEVSPDEEATAIEIAKKRFPESLKPEEELLSEEIETKSGEIQQISEEMTFGQPLPTEERVVTMEKFKPNPEGGARLNEDYYGITRKGGKVVYEGGEATPNETLAVRGFLRNEQNKKKGQYPELFGGDPSEIFQQYEPQIVDYINKLQQSRPDLYADFKRKVEAGNFTQEDQYGVIAKIESDNLQRDIRYARIAIQRRGQGEEGYD